MLEGFKAFTITHNEVKAGNLSQFVLDKSSQDELLPTLKESCKIDELLYLSTCNRILYFIYTKDKNFTTSKSEFFSRINPEIDSSLLVNVKFYEGHDAVNHLFKVASSLDSMVIGEREIFRQLREAYAYCKELNLCGDSIRLAMRFCVESAKEIYANTKIGERKVSVVSLAMDQFKKKNISTEDKIIMVGAGQSNELVSKFLTKMGYHNVRVYNRNKDRAINLAKRFKNGSAHPLEELHLDQESFSAMIVCTGSITPLVTPELFDKTNFKNGDKFIIDLSIPFNVSKEVGLQNNVELISVEELQEMAKENLSFRQNELSNALVIIRERIEEFKKLFQQRLIERAMGEVPVEIRKIKERAINEVFNKEIADMDPKTKDIFLKAMDYMEKKCIGVPMKAAKKIVIE